MFQQAVDVGVMMADGGRRHEESRPSLAGKDEVEKGADRARTEGAQGLETTTELLLGNGGTLNEVVRRMALLVQEVEGGEIDLRPTVESDLLAPETDGLAVEAVPADPILVVDPEGLGVVGEVEPDGVGPDLPLDRSRAVHDEEVPEGTIVFVFAPRDFLDDEGTFEGLSIGEIADFRDRAALNGFRQVGIPPGVIRRRISSVSKRGPT